MADRRTRERAVVAGLAMALGGLLAALFYLGPAPHPSGFVLHESGVQSLLDENSQGFGGEPRGENYALLLDAMYANGNVTQVVDGNLWVPWYTTSSQCGVAQLHSGGSCNSGETIDMQHNCMVTDEFSQVGILVAMDDNQARMDEFYNTVLAISSTFGSIPAWRVYRSGSTIEPCRTGINGNCDTASDATARIIIALYTAADNANFGSGQRAAYRQHANLLAAEMVEYEMDGTCRPSDLGHGDICYWLAAGSRAKQGGLASTDYGYTGYYADAIIATLQACGQTGNSTFCSVAANLTLNYLQAAEWDGNSFSAPPGRSFKWTNLGGVPKAECTNTCSPVTWDGADAVRALGMCQALHYASLVNVTLPGLATYCQQWQAAHGQNPTSMVIQYKPDGTAGSSAQSGYFAQGLQGLFSMGASPSTFAQSVDSALSHYTTSLGTWDYTQCFGVYTQAFPIRALGAGLGRDFSSFRSVALGGAPIANVSNISLASSSPANPAVRVEPNGETFSISVTNPASLPLTVSWLLDGVEQATGTSYSFPGGYDTEGSYNVTARVSSSANNLSVTWALVIVDNDVNVSEPAEEPVLPAPVVQQPTSSGGGGGGGAFVAQEAEHEWIGTAQEGSEEERNNPTPASSPESTTPKDPVLLVLESYFETESLSSVELIAELRTLLGGGG